MKKLLLPYAYDVDGNLVHADDAPKGQYTCPICRKNLILRRSRKAFGEKWYKRDHFAHKVSTDNHCSESYLHKLFKERCAEYILSKIQSNEPLRFVWQCEKCDELHEGDLCRKAVSVVLEYDLGVCQPDIALLDGEGQVCVVVEIVVTHKPSSEAMHYYDTHKIGCLQVAVEDFSDCDRVAEKLSHPFNVNLCRYPACTECGGVMYPAKMVIFEDECPRCFSKMRLAEVISSHYAYGPDDFDDSEVAIARELGVNRKMLYNEKAARAFSVIVCDHCATYISSPYVDIAYNEHLYEERPFENERELGYKCFRCFMRKSGQRSKDISEREQKKREQLKNIGHRICPNCGCELKERKSEYGLFLGCTSYPNCKYTESVKKKITD